MEWKWKALESLCYKNSRRDVVHTYNGKMYNAVFFILRQYFRTWRAIFYDGKQKVFPKNLELTLLSLAVWYMDDGCWTGKKIVISTESFNEESMQFIQDVLFKKFNIETVASSNGKLVIRKKFHEIFCKLISPYVVSSMKYKVPKAL